MAMAADNITATCASKTGTAGGIRAVCDLDMLILGSVSGAQLDECVLSSTTCEWLTIVRSRAISNAASEQDITLAEWLLNGCQE